MSEITTQGAFRDLVITVRELGEILSPAVAARYDAPPGGAGGGGQIPNPTLDIVLDPRRLALSDEVSKSTTDIRRVTRLLGEHTEALRRAVTRWEGGEDEVTTCPSARPTHPAPTLEPTSTSGSSPKPAPSSERAS